MSLVRDRYEQTVRFSWLFRQPDLKELNKYLVSYFGKLNKTTGGATPDAMANLAERGILPEWTHDLPTKDQQKFLEAWSALDLRSMASKRDALPVLSTAAIARKKLLDYYPVIYAHFSSVSHYDMFSFQMLELQKSTDGKLVLSPHPHWPAVLTCYTAFFDILQCYEATHAFKDSTDDRRFDGLLKEWSENTRKLSMVAFKA
jgi:hypothetical protein